MEKISLILARSLLGHSDMGLAAARDNVLQYVRLTSSRFDFSECTVYRHLSSKLL